MDLNRLIFFDGVTWGDLGAGFSSSPTENNTVLGFHYYAPPQADPTEHAGLQFKAQARVANNLGTGLFLTETSQPGPGKEGETDKFSCAGCIGDAADATLVSWAGYEFKSFCRESDATESGQSQMADWGACKTGYSKDWSSDSPDFMSAAGRTYARAVAGNVVSMSLDMETMEFRLEYDVSDVSLSGAVTEIFAYAGNYEKGMDVNVEGSAVYDFDEEQGLFFVTVDSAATCIGEKVVVKITRMS